MQYVTDSPRTFRRKRSTKCQLTNTFRLVLLGNSREAVTNLHENHAKQIAVNIWIKLSSGVNDDAFLTN